MWGQLLAGGLAAVTMGAIVASQHQNNDLTGKINTTHQSEVGTKVNSFVDQLKYVPFRAPGVNTNNWNSTQGMNQFQVGTEHLWRTDQFFKAYNTQVQAYVDTMPRQDLEVDLFTQHRNRTTYIDWLDKGIGSRQAGIVSTNGLDVALVGGYKNPQNDYLPTSMFNKGVA